MCLPCHGHDEINKTPPYFPWNTITKFLRKFRIHDGRSPCGARRCCCYNTIYTLWLPDYTGHVRDLRMETVRIQWAQIQQVVTLVTLVKKSKILQGDPTVSSVLTECMLCAGKIETILQKNSAANGDGPIERTKKKFLATMKDNSTMALFNKLEIHKSTLMICIQRTDS